MTWKTIEAKHTDKELCEIGKEFLEDLTNNTNWGEGKARVTIHKRDLSVALFALEQLDERIKLVKN